MELRELFPVVKKYRFLNHAAQSPLPKVTVEAMVKAIENLRDEGELGEEVEEVKEVFASFIGAGRDEVAFIPNTSTGVNIVATMIPFKPGDNVAVNDLEYPSNVYPWLKLKGVEVRYARSVNGFIAPEAYEEAVDDRTRVVAVSHVSYANGFRHDLKELAKLAHDHGAYLFVDAAQSVGVLNVDVKSLDVDFLATATYKWLLGPSGAGFLYVKSELVSRFEPAFVGWASVKPEVFEAEGLWDIWSINWAEDARRFEVGTPSEVSLIGAKASLNLIKSYGVANVELKVLGLTGRLIEGLLNLGLKLQTPLEDKHRSGIVNFKVEKPKELCNALKARGIITSVRANGIRVSPHFYNLKDEVDYLLEALKELRVR